MRYTQYMHQVRRLVTSTQSNIWYALFLSLLAILCVGMLIYEFIPENSPELVNKFQKIDFAIALIFLLDFIVGFFLNTTYTKKIYIKKNWLNFVSSIPVTSDITRVLRILRVVRAFRVIRAGLNLWYMSGRYTASKK